MTPAQDPLDNDGWTAFDADGPETAVEALCRLRSVHRFGVVLASGRVDPSEPWTGLSDLVDAIDVDAWFGEGPFAVRGHRSGDHPFTSVDVAAHVGDVLHDHLESQLGLRPHVDLDDPDAILRVHLDDEGRTRLWLDLVGQASLHRRGYRVYDHPAGMKASLACGLLELADPPREGLVDPMAGGGTLVVEAAWKALGVRPVALRVDDLLAWNVPAFDELRPPGAWLGRAEEGLDPGTRFVIGDHAPNHVEGAKRNLQTAGIEDVVETYVGDVTTLPQHAERVPLVASNLPYGIRSGEGPLEETYEAWIAAGLAALEGGGQLGFMTPKTELVETLATKRGLDLVERVDVQHGRLEIALIVLQA